MKNGLALIILASFTIILVGCSERVSKAPTPPAIDLVQAGKDVEFGGGCVLSVAKREGNSLEGIHVRIAPPDKQVQEITAETGTIESGTPEHSSFENQVTLTLHNAKAVAAGTNITASSMTLVLYK